MKNKSKQLKIKEKKQVETYDKILDKRMDEILKMSREIDYYNWIYKSKGSTKAIFILIYTIYTINLYLWSI